MNLPVQILLFLVIFILTALLVFCGVETYFILKELKVLVKRLNHVFDELGLITSSIAKPLSGFSGFLAGLKSGAEIIKILKGKKEEKN